MNNVNNTDTATRYTGIAIILHWLVALGLLINVAVIWVYPFFDDQYIRFAIDSHKSIGITLLGLALLRLTWRLSHPPPAYPIKQAFIERFLAKATHILLYGLMLLLPLSGWMHDSAWKAANEVKMYWFGLFEWPRFSWIMEMEAQQKEMLHSVFGGFHTWFSYLLYALVVLHLAAAMKHHFSKQQRVRGRGIL